MGSLQSTKTSQAPRPSDPRFKQLLQQRASGDAYGGYWMIKKRLDMVQWVNISRERTGVGGGATLTVFPTSSY